MKTLTINKITIENFKNIDKMVQELGQTVRVEGANETGKTTFADAISWCLTGKNSLGEANPAIIPSGKPESSPSVCLEITLTDGGNSTEITLQRTHAAKFNKAKEYTGDHATVCYINSVKTNIKDFDAWVDMHICNREIFRLIYDTRYFTENIATTAKEKAWEAQRRLLFEVCGVKADIDLAKKRKKFAPLLDNLPTYDNASQYLNYLKGAYRNINSELAEAETKIGVYNDLLANMPKGLSGAKIQADIEQVTNEGKEKFAEWKKASEECQARTAKLHGHLAKLEAEKSYPTQQLKTIADGCAALENALKNNDFSTVCPTCGATLDEAKVQEQINATKAKLEANKKEYAKWRTELNAIEIAIRKTKAELDGLKMPEAPAERNEYAQKLTDLRQMLAKFEEQEKYKVLIAEIDTKRGVLLEQRSYFQQQIDLCREFIDYKCEQATKAINTMFDGVTFELFRQNKTNDEVKECCDIFWQGIPYAGLSYSAKFVVGLKIALAFQKHYGVQVPLAVDNAESIDFDSHELAQQVILLTKKEEICPECGGLTGRKQADGKWYCQRCSSEVEKTLHFENLR